MQVLPGEDAERGRFRTLVSARSVRGKGPGQPRGPDGVARLPAGAQTGLWPRPSCSSGNWCAGPALAFTVCWPEGTHAANPGGDFMSQTDQPPGITRTPQPPSAVREPAGLPATPPAPAPPAVPRGAWMALTAALLGW